MKAHNVWVITESDKALDIDANDEVPSLVKKPSIFKKPIDNSTKCNVYTLSKYLSKYEFGSEQITSETRKGSQQRKKISNSKRKGSNHKLDLESVEAGGFDSHKGSPFNLYCSVDPFKSDNEANRFSKDSINFYQNQLSARNKNRASTDTFAFKSVDDANDRKINCPTPKVSGVKDFRTPSSKAVDDNKYEFTSKSIGRSGKNIQTNKGVN